MQFFKIRKLNDKQYQLIANDLIVSCQVGENGIVKNTNKIEGDKCTPTGIFELKKLYYKFKTRKIDFINLEKTVKLKKITKLCGWCDDPNHSKYNQYINLNNENNFLGSYEHLWRKDEAYDLFFDLNYNTNPIKRFKGSAIFFHCSFKDERPTKGCIAIKKKYFYDLLNRINQPTSIIIEDIHYK